MKEFKTVLDLSKQFPDEKSCLNYLMKGKTCPYCTSTVYNYIKTRRKFQCKKCRRQFTPKKGTIFEQSSIPLSKWFLAIYLCTNKKNISAQSLAVQLDVGTKSAWFMLQKLKNVLYE